MGPRVDPSKSRMSIAPVFTRPQQPLHQGLDGGEAALGLGRHLGLDEVAVDLADHRHDAVGADAVTGEQGIAAHAHQLSEVAGWGGQIMPGVGIGHWCDAGGLCRDQLGATRGRWRRSRSPRQGRLIHSSAAA